MSVSERTERARKARPMPWGELYGGGGQPHSVTAGDQKAYDHFERGSRALAEAVKRYQMGWR